MREQKPGPQFTHPGRSHGHAARGRKGAVSQVVGAATPNDSAPLHGRSSRTGSPLGAPVGGLRRAHPPARGRLVLLAGLLALVFATAACAADDDGGDDGGDAEAEQLDDADADADDADEDDSAEDDEDEVVEPDADEGEVDEGAFYHDTVLEMFIATDTGGGTDTQGRFLAPYFAEHIPGNPSVQPVNVPGAGGIVGSNEWWMDRDHEEADSIYFSFASGLFPWVFQEEALELDYAQMEGLMGIQTGGLAYVNPDETGIENVEDFIEEAQSGEVEFIAGEQTPDSLGIVFMLAYDMLDLNHDVIMGYEGRGPARPAFEQGELNINWDTTASLPEQVDPLIEDGSAVPVFTAGQVEDGELVEDVALAEEYDVPTFDEMYEEIHGEAPGGPEFEAYIEAVNAGFTVSKVMWLHEDAPQEAKDELHEGFERIVEDEEFQEEAEEFLDTHAYDILIGDEVEAAASNLIDWDPEVQDFVLDFIVEEHDHPDPRE
ncbi:hypothetical protein ER308_15230 [Egibacter rhizosphaerae]|uniref:Tripartite tricarboxylate transporter substrate binding protein n=1 Tax=Egibacter rhizosphaerae TaxID=1670831 RepID=A0A411YHT9_9ACTN|nr:hypothetical protein [Egibacter rhizosphaerae]QBI20783.1 hypothetical protein ER308_15230 [Egibacter rhizosphaerae]